MDLTIQKDHASQIRGIFDHIPHNRWMILPFLSKAKPPPLIDGLQKFRNQPVVVTKQFYIFSMLMV